MKNPMISFTVIRKAAFVAFSVLVAAGMVFAATNKAAPTKPSSGIIINHAQKVNKLGVSCEVCHSPSAKDPRLMSFPTMDACSACHAKETDMAAGTDACAKCHTNEDYSSKVRKDTVLMPSIVFDHAKHQAANVSCASCHTVFDKVGVTGDEMLPKMSTCMACHTKAKVSNDCATCHTNTAIGTDRPASHTPFWSKNHGRALSKKTIDQSCNVCHTVAAGNDCASCHQREAPTNHNQAWSRSGHGLAAKTNRNQCSTCHTESQCITCHTTEPPASHTASWGSPSDRHCYSCHISDFPTASYGSGKIGSNCSVCHSSASVLASHQSVPRTVAHSGYVLACSNCHNAATNGIVIPKISHPFPPGTAGDGKCISCHI